MSDRLAIVRALVEGDNWSIMAIAVIVALFAAAAWLLLSIQAIRAEKRETMKKRQRDLRAIGAAADMRDRSR